MSLVGNDLLLPTSFSVGGLTQLHTAKILSSRRNKIYIGP